MKKALIIFSKSPTHGRVKTRLRPRLSHAQTGGLYRAFVEDILSATQKLRGVTTFMACTPTSKDPFFKLLTDQYPVGLLEQRGNDLGTRMRNVFQEVLEAGFGKVVIIGSDSPTLPLEYIRKAFYFLSDHDLVLGPSQDGGYYMIGCRKDIPAVFEGVPWGSDQVLSVTLNRVADHKLNCTLLPFWYDVDTPSDLMFLFSHLRYLEQKGLGHTSLNTQKFLKTLDLMDS